MVKLNFENGRRSALAGCTSWRYLHFQLGDLDGFMQHFLNNLGTSLIVAKLLTDTYYNPRLNSDYGADYTAYLQENTAVSVYLDQVVNEYVARRILVGLAMSIIAGSLYYTWMAVRVHGDREGDNKATSMPFGVNTPAAFAFLGGILGPVAKREFDSCFRAYIENDFGSPDDVSMCLEDAINTSWTEGVLSNFVCSLISTALCVFGPLIVKYTPQVSLLTSLSTVGISFLLIQQLSFNFANPVAGYLPVLLVVLGYFCEIKLWKIPTAVSIVLVGAALSWATGANDTNDVAKAVQTVGWQGIVTSFRVLGSDWAPVLDYFGIIFPFAVQAAVGTMMNVVSARTAGDFYPVTESIIVDGLASVVGSLFGTPLMTSVYIGHPGLKKMGATSTYALFTSIGFFIFAITGVISLINGILVPSSLAPIIAFIGLIICAGSMDGLPPRHYIVFILGLLPGICNWASQNGLAGTGSSRFGYIAMGGPGNMLFSMVLCAIMAFVCDRNFWMAAIWSIFAAALSSIGLLHQDSVSFTDFNIPHHSYCILRDDLGSQAIAWIQPSNSSNPPTECQRNFVKCAGGQGCGWEATTQMWFMVSYLMLFAVFAILYGLQRLNKFDMLERIVDSKPDSEDDSVNDWSKDEESQIDSIVEAVKMD